jgi:hypothetical protein
MVNKTHGEEKEAPPRKLLGQAKRSLGASLEKNSGVDEARKVDRAGTAAGTLFRNRNTYMVKRTQASLKIPLLRGTLA